MVCTHFDSIRQVTLFANGREALPEDRRLRGPSSPVPPVVASAAAIARKRLVTKHYHATGHPIMKSYDLPEPLGWCYADEEMLDFIGNQTIHVQASSVASSIASRNEKSP